MIVKAACSLLSVLLGGQVSLVARPVAREPLAIATAQCEHFALTVTEPRRLLPLESFTLEGERVQLGWKPLALLLAPLWLLVAPALLPMLLGVWLVAPGGPRAGTLAFDALEREADFARGAWPAVLSAVLSTITRATLPALLVDAAERPGGAALGGLSQSVPSSTCTGASVKGTKLVFDGRVPLYGNGQPPLEYTLRTGVRPLRSDVGLDGTPLGAARSTLCIALAAAFVSRRTPTRQHHSLAHAEDRCRTVR